MQVFAKHNSELQYAVTKCSAAPFLFGNKKNALQCEAVWIYLGLFNNEIKPEDTKRQESKNYVVKIPVQPVCSRVKRGKVCVTEWGVF